MTATAQITTLPGRSLLLEQLTDRELEVLQLVAAGRRNREIAATLRISVKTVEFHLANTFDKLCAKTRTEAVVRALQAGMLRLAATS